MNRQQIFNAVDIISHAFRYIDARLINHGERVAYILMEMLKESTEYLPQEKKDIFMLALLHDIGAYKNEEIDSMLSFDSHNTMEHSVYGYLLFKNFSPLPEYADVILHHHHSNAQYYAVPISDRHRNIAKLIYLADRLDIYQVLNDTIDIDSFFESFQEDTFSISDIELFRTVEKKFHIMDNIRSGNYTMELAFYTQQDLLLSDSQMHDYLVMFVFSVDFRTDYTALHTIYAVHLSQQIAKVLRLTSTSCKVIELSALLHNVGKVSLPSHLITTADYEQYLKILYENSTLSVTKDILDHAVDSQIIHIIDQSFVLLDCWSQNKIVSFLPSPAAEIVSLSYLLSNSLTLDTDIGGLQRERNIISFLKGKYRICHMDDTILQSLEKNYDQIITNTHLSCTSVSDIYRQMTEEHRTLNLILLSYNRKYC